MLSAAEMEDLERRIAEVLPGGEWHGGAAWLDTTRKRFSRWQTASSGKLVSTPQNIIQNGLIPLKRSSKLL